MSQQIEEAKRVAQDWAQNFAPEDLVKNFKNAKLLADYCDINFGVITAGNLTKAYNALRDQLDLIPPPPAVVPKTAEQLAQEEILRQHADYMQSIKPQPSFEGHVRAEAAKKNAEKAAKDQADAEGQLKTAIDGYQCYRGPNQIDYPRTDMVKAELKTVIVRANGKRDSVGTLAVVREVIVQLPDRPQAGDVRKVIDAINNRRQVN